MLAETKTLSVNEAREQLRDTSRMSSEQMAELQAVVDAFHRLRPHRRCVACGCGQWSEHTADGAPVWACARCHRSASLTLDEWNLQQAPVMAAWGQRSAAIRRLAAEEYEQRLEATAAARAAYIEGIGDLRWMLRNGAVPHNDARPARLLAEIDAPVSRWPDAASASGARLEQRLAAIMQLGDA